MFTSGAERGKLTTITGSVSAPGNPFADERFDKAFAVNSMQVWENVAMGLHEIRRVLKPGGGVGLCFTINSGQSRDSVLGTLAAAGFAQARMVEQEWLFCAIAKRP